MNREKYPRLTRLLERNRHGSLRIGVAMISLFGITATLSAAAVSHFAQFAL